MALVLAATPACSIVDITGVSALTHLLLPNLLRQVLLMDQESLAIVVDGLLVVPKRMVACSCGSQTLDAQQEHKDVMMTRAAKPSGRLVPGRMLPRKKKHSTLTGPCAFSRASVNTFTAWTCSPMPCQQEHALRPRWLQRHSSMSPLIYILSSTCFMWL